MTTVGAVATVAGTSHLLAFACASTTTCKTAGAYDYGPFVGSAGLLAPAPPATVPGAPTGLTATPGNDQVSLSWTAPSSDGGLAVTGYDIYQGTAAGQETTTPVNSSPVTGTAYTVKGFSDGTKYYFTVEAVNAVGNGPASNEASATTPATLPGTPTGLTATPGNDQVSLSWSPPASDGGATVTGYDIYRAPPPARKPRRRSTRPR